MNDLPVHSYYHQFLEPYTGEGMSVDRFYLCAASPRRNDWDPRVFRDSLSYKLEECTCPDCLICIDQILEQSIGQIDGASGELRPFGWAPDPDQQTNPTDAQDAL